MHANTAGIDTYCAAKDFREADHIKLTNSKGMYSDALAEWVAMGMLFFTK